MDESQHGVEHKDKCSYTPMVDPAFLERSTELRFIERSSEPSEFSIRKTRIDGLKVVVEDVPIQINSSNDFLAAVLGCFLSVTGGVALGGYIFPSDESHPNAAFQVAGMQIGLLASTVSSWVAYFKSEVSCGVPGGIFPSVIALGSTYFKSIGPKSPHTIMFALPLITFLQGVLLYFVARLPHLERVVKCIPYIVFCGFLAGTGAVCIQGGLEMAAGSSLTSEQYWKAPAHWVPPLVVAVTVYACQQLGAPMKEMLFPLSLLLLALGFYVVYWFCNGMIDLASARKDGFLYKFEVPSSPSFYQVWSLQNFGCVQWDRLFDHSFLTAFINSSILTVVCIVESLYAVVESTGLKISFRKEMENTALMNVVSGAMGAMPTNHVISYSIVAHKSGARSQLFLLYLSIISSIFFLVADYILSLTPIMVPAAALIWVGVAMFWGTVYDGFQRLSPIDYAVIWMMIVVNIFKGSDEMLVAGLAVTCLQLAYRLSTINVIDSQHTSCTERSRTVYPLGKDAILDLHGDDVLILHLTKGLLFFGSAFKIQELVEERVAQSAAPRRMTQMITQQFSMGSTLSSRVSRRSTKCDLTYLRFLVLDLTLIEYLEISGIKTLHFIVHELAEKHGFQVVFAGLGEESEEILERFFDHTDYLIKFPEMNEALRHVENELFLIHDRDIVDQSIPIASSHVQNVVPKSKAVFLPVAFDVHYWLHNNTDEYDAEQVLPCLVEALRYMTCSMGDNICVTKSVHEDINSELADRAPLIWVLSGRVALLHQTYETCEFARTRTFSKVLSEKCGAGQTQRNPGDVLQIADVEVGTKKKNKYEPLCAGPLDTFRHFYNSYQMPPVTARVDSEEATVAVLTYIRFDSMPPNVAKAIMNYISQKQFVSSAMSRA